MYEKQVNPRLKSIAEFLDGQHHFVIPSYQRGYRWEERQVRDLLDDILEFQNEVKGKRESTVGEFYCLQPIVVMKLGDGRWEVIDGQQRLTTLLILLSSLKPQLDLLRLPRNLFSLEYETREKDALSSRLFLERITNVTAPDKTNVDFFRMSEAYLTVKQWLESEDLNIGDFCNTLLKTDFDGDVDRANNVRFIWYELDPGGDAPNVAFAKYNRGKIDLTNAELIKALFYLSDSTEGEREKKKYQMKIGYEWEDIEKTLQSDDMWGFLNPIHSYENHIQLVFELLAEKYVSKTTVNVNKKVDSLWSFFIFNELIATNAPIFPDTYKSARDFLWDEVKVYHRTFVEWFSENAYYHLIGFLLQVGKGVEQIKRVTESHSKSDLIPVLKTLIKGHFGGVDINRMGYEEDVRKAKELLLLFNVVSTMNSGYNRFPFHLFRKGRWSLEHIHAQRSDELTSVRQRRQLLDEQLDYFKSHGPQEIHGKIEQMLTKTDIDEEKFESLQDMIFASYSNSPDVHSLKNLCLLTAPDNSCLNNNIFPIKRDLIRRLDEQGSFIPLCTKNVFLKYYSAGVEQNVKWDRADMERYADQITSVLGEYVNFIENEYEAI